MPWADLLWFALGAGLIVYAITGGADLGAGLWSALARGPRRAAQRKAVVDAIAPIWEANHVWLIFVIVVMFSAFSRAFAAISIALHIPIALALLGIVLRGAAYVFHAYGIQSDDSRERWSMVFAWSSALTPLMLGVVVGALSTSQIRVIDGRVTSGFVAGWTTPFAWLVGCFALALFALLSAVYLAAESDGDLADDFRKRALVCEVVAGAFAAGVLWTSRAQAPDLYEQLVRSPWTWPLQGATALAALTTVCLLHWRRHRLARYAAATQVALVVLGWGAAMDKHFVLPDLSVDAAIPNPEVLPFLTITLGGGSVVLAPALWFLYRVFKRPREPETR